MREPRKEEISPSSKGQAEAGGGWQGLGGGLQEGASQTCVGCRQRSSCCSPYSRETPKMGAESTIWCAQLGVSVPPCAWVTQGQAEHSGHHPLHREQVPQKEGGKQTTLKQLLNCHTKGNAQGVSYCFWGDLNYPSAAFPCQLPAFQLLGHRFVHAAGGVGIMKA